MGEEKFTPEQWHMTKVFRLHYAALWAPTEFKNDGKPKYRATMLFKKGSAGEKHIRELYEKELEAKFRGKVPRGFKSPIQDGDGTGWDGHEDHVFVRATTQYEITIKDYDPEGKNPSKRIPLDRMGEVYNGVYGRTLVQIWFYKHSSGAQGASFNFNGFQKIKDGELLEGGGAVSDKAFDDEMVDVDDDDPTLYDDPLS